MCFSRAFRDDSVSVCGEKTNKKNLNNQVSVWARLLSSFKAPVTFTTHMLSANLSPTPIAMRLDEKELNQIAIQ